MSTPEQSLWCAVIAAAIADGRSSNEHTRATARRFLANSSALRTILNLLGINPDWWRWRLLPALSRQWQETAGTGDLTVTAEFSEVRSAAVKRSWETRRAKAAVRAKANRDRHAAAAAERLAS